MRSWTAVILVLLALPAAIIVAGCSSSSSPSSAMPWYVDAEWTAGASFTKGSTLGAALAWDGDGSLYTCSGYISGQQDEFWMYDIAADSWTELGPPAVSAYWSTCMAWTGGDEMYATYGNGTTGFYRYTISTDSWTQMESFPEAGVRRMGQCIVWPGEGDFVYVAKGDNSSVFCRYNTVADSWAYMAPVPNTMGDGTQIAWGGGTSIFAAADDQQFFEYDIGADAWETRAPYPDALNFGAWLCYDGDESLVLSRGDTTATLWRYDIPGDSWESLEDAPVTMTFGGTMVVVDDILYMLPGGGSTDFWVLGR